MSSCAIRTASTASSSIGSARARIPAAVDRRRSAEFSVGTDGRKKSCRAMRRRWPGWRTSPVWDYLPPVRDDNLDHPDELRVDLDPVPGVEWSQIRAVAGIVARHAGDFGLTGWPKTSGSRGIHIYVRIERRWTFSEVHPRGARVRPRGREARTRSDDQQVVEGRAARRIPGLQPERQRPHDRRGLFRAAQARPPVCAALLGRDRRVRAGRLHDGDDAASLCGRRRSPHRHGPACRLAGVAARIVLASRT